MISITIIFSVLFAFISGIHCENIKVAVKLGSIRGYKEKIDNNDVNVFLGIPFAVPPIGDLRFRKPQPITKIWTELLDATKWPKICMQETMFVEYYNKISEDCLYLNVWTPVNLDKDFSSNLRPVMVFIHGGGFTVYGISHKHQNASILSSFGDVVVVTMNYRLGAFGFLTADNSGAPGNVGLYDQALALEWVQENIAYFGGDPKKVTLFGESAGAWSISLHLHSPLSQRINQAILMSGSIYRSHFLDSKEVGIQKTLELAKLLGCTFEEEVKRVTDNHMECLRKADANKILELQSLPQIVMLSSSLGKVPFMPVFGEAFIPKKPIEMLEQKSNEGIDMLVGTMANEGQAIHLVMELFRLFQNGWQKNLRILVRLLLRGLSNVLLKTLANEGYITDFGNKMFRLISRNDNWQKKLRFEVNLWFKDVSNKEIEEILIFYFNGINEKSNDEARMAYYTALGDVFFNCEATWFTEVFSKSNDVYQFLFDYQLANVYDNLGPCDLHKACHGNELPLTFGTVSDPKDIAVSKMWMKMLTDFAKTGTVGWPKHGNRSRPYYEFTGNKSSDRLLYDFRGDACRLWKPLFKKYL